MGSRLSKIYTRTGDDGDTGLGTGQRVSKADLRVESYGTVDELNSYIGLCIAVLTDVIHQLDKADTNNFTLEELAAFKQKLLLVQQELFDLGGELCIPDSQYMQFDMVSRLEQEIDQKNQQLQPLKNFILPGGHILASHLHVARTICRRAERQLVALTHHETVQKSTLAYLNRLSDWLFVMARWLNLTLNQSETLWQPIATRK